MSSSVEEQAMEEKKEKRIGEREQTGTRPYLARELLEHASPHCNWPLDNEQEHPANLSANCRRKSRVGQAAYLPFVPLHTLPSGQGISISYFLNPTKVSTIASWLCSFSICSLFLLAAFAVPSMSLLSALSVPSQCLRSTLSVSS